MRKAIGFFVATMAVVIASWWWRGLPIPMPANPLPAGAKLHCVSYAPFRGNQTPLDPTTVIPPSQIDEDLAHLARLTDCVRIYSVDMGLDRVPEIAAKHGLRVLLGIWISSEARRNQQQVAAGVALANRFPETVRAVIVGNEVLLRGEQSAQGLDALIRSVRAQVRVPVTYADVWEFWIRNRDLAASVDFVTVHILPYWEDIPIATETAAGHIASIRAHVASEFSGKEVLIGEAGWPSHGRMREGARPSPADQARVLHDLLALSIAGKFNVNFIEAFDQPWKRYLEGTVGGYWGLFSDARRGKFEWGAPVSNSPNWAWQALGGVVLAALVFAIGLGLPWRSDGDQFRSGALLPVSAIACSAGMMAGEAMQATLIEGLGPGGWLRSVLQSVAALTAPLTAAFAIARGTPLPALQDVIGLRDGRRRDGLSRALVSSMALTCVMAVEAALGLDFNPRYLDFPYAAITGAAVPMLVVALWNGGRDGRPPIAETVIAAMLALSTLKIVWVETLANWQALWLCAAFLVLGFTLVRARAAQG